MNIKSDSLEKVILDRLLRTKKISINQKITSAKINIKIKKYRKIVYFNTIDFGNFNINEKFDNVSELTILQKITQLSQIEILKKIVNSLAFIKNNYKEYIFDIEFLFK